MSAGCAIAAPRALDYSAPVTRAAIACPHDLVWFDGAALPADVPDWARRLIADGAPAVIRRGPRDEASLPIGIRGATKRRRCATRIDSAAVTRRLAPEAIASGENGSFVTADRRSAIPAFAGLHDLQAELAAMPLTWGVTGALGYELATGAPVAHAASDIDIVVCMPERYDLQLETLAGAARCCDEAHGLRCDIQLETPSGGVALADWLGDAARVMIKHDTGPYLSADPWRDP